jgi:hypothetical protein
VTGKINIRAQKQENENTRRDKAIIRQITRLSQATTISRQGNHVIHIIRQSQDEQEHENYIAYHQEQENIAQGKTIKTGQHNTT